MQRERQRDGGYRYVSSTLRDDIDQGLTAPAVRADPLPPTPNDVDDDAATSTVDEQTRRFVRPSWLRGLWPISWPSSDACSKNGGVRRGQNCCLFSPLGYCRETDVINGFCVFHLRAVFNLVYQTDCLYMLNADRKPAMSQRTACYVAEPQPINDEYTTVFPVMELMPNEIRLQDIKLHNLAKHLRSHGTQNWERVYANHVNYLYRLFTMYSPDRIAGPVEESRVDQLTNTQLLMHWGLWNEYYSKVILDTPVDLYPTYMDKDDRTDIMMLPVRRCTTVTQMIARLFGISYTNYNSVRFFATVSNYGIFGSAHWAYANNMCSVGTHCTKGSLPCIGNMAMMAMLRTDGNGTCRPNTVHYTRVGDCGDKYCVPARVNLDAGSLNQTVVYSTKGPMTQPPA